MDVERVEALVRLLHGACARELLVEAEGWRISVTKGPPPVARAVVMVPHRALTDPTESEEEGLIRITAPMVGIFHAGSQRIEPGEQVESGQTVGSIESMKIINPLISEVGGVITAVEVEDGQPVEYGQPLMEIRPGDVAC